MVLYAGDMNHVPKGEEESRDLGEKCYEICLDELR